MVVLQRVLLQEEPWIRAKAMLRSTSIPVKNISLELGFSQESNFNNFFKLHIGMTPMQYRINANAIIFGENTALS